MYHLTPAVANRTSKRCLLSAVVQMLVYENYNKFITATDTIKLMSSSMEGMDERMHALRGLIGEAWL